MKNQCSMMIRVVSRKLFLNKLNPGAEKLNCEIKLNPKVHKANNKVEEVLAAQQLELLFTDSESTLEPEAPSKQLSTKKLRMTIVDLKERLLRGEILSFIWLSMK